jgi:serine phosphatase RsbU (regulator of sigma subunit)
VIFVLYTDGITEAQNPPPQSSKRRPVGYLLSKSGCKRTKSRRILDYVLQLVGSSPAWTASPYW